MEIDIRRLRQNLKDYYGTAMFNASPAAVIDLSAVEKATDQEIVEMAEKMGMDLKKYIS